MGGGPKYGASRGINVVPIEANPEVSKFFWGEGNIIPDIDAMNERFGAEPLDERPCPFRFSIGAILFKRALWEEMRAFKVRFSGTSLGKDEIQICSYCFLNSMPIMVSENVVVGHFAFGRQNASMKEYYYEHPEKFTY